MLAAVRPAPLAGLLAAARNRAPALAPAARRLSLFSGEPKSSQPVDQKLDLSHLLTQSAWSRQELDRIKAEHREPADWVDRAAQGTVRTLRRTFDVFSLYSLKRYTGRMTEADWVRRIIFLETVAGVPGMVAGMLRHLHSLRLMRRDYGWIHSLLSEAENERMHLLIALSLRQPGPIFRAAVIGGQAVFLTWYSISYMLCPRYCHRFVGYLEEEAVHTYTKLLEDIDADHLPLFKSLQAPRMARAYYSLPEDAVLRDVFECMRADEAAHRDTNHHLSDLKPDEPNTMVEHLRRSHFTHQNVFSGLSACKDTEKSEEQRLGVIRQRGAPKAG